MSSTSAKKKVDTTRTVDTTSNVDKSGANALASDAGGGDGPSSSKSKAERVVDKKAPTDPPDDGDIVVSLDTWKDAVLCWFVGMELVLLTQLEWIVDQMFTGDKQDSFFVVSLLFFFVFGFVIFLQEAFEFLRLFPPIRKVVERRGFWHHIFSFKDTGLVPIWALAASGMWSVLWRYLVCKSSHDEISKWNAVGRYVVAEMKRICVGGKWRISVGTCERVVSFAPLAVVSFAAFFCSLAFSDVVRRVQKKIAASKKPRSVGTEGHVEKAKEAVKGFQVPWLMLAISYVQVMAFYCSEGTKLPLILKFDPSRRHELWRWLSVALVHSSPSHLWGNVKFQLVATLLLQLVHSCSNRSMAGIYLLGVLGGSLAHSLLWSTVGGVGASAGGSSLYYALIARSVLGDSRKHPPCPKLRATHLVSLVGPRSFFFSLLSPVVLGIFYYFRLQLGLCQIENIGHEAHAGGAVAGFLGALFVFLKDTPSEVMKKKYVKDFAGILVVGVLAVNVLMPGNYPKPEWNFTYRYPPGFPYPCV